MSGETAYKRPESVLVAIYTADGETLLLERADREGYWQSVTGSLEQDEDTDSAAARELLEETGLYATPTPAGESRVFEIFEHWRDRYGPGVTHNREHEFRLRLPGTVPIIVNPREHRSFEWVPLREAAERVFSWTNREVLEAIATALETVKSPTDQS